MTPSPFVLRMVNQSLTCEVFPRKSFPDGLTLTYASCPETYDSQTHKIIRYCCLQITFNFIQDSLYKKTQDWLRYNSSTLLVVPALLFNILSLAVLLRFQRSKLAAQTSTTFYMKCLCIFDTLTMISKFLYEVIVVRNGLRKHPFVITDFMCKSLSFAESLCAISSIYLLIAMTIDKLICVLTPLKVGQLLTPSKARIIVTCILVISTFISSYNLFDKRSFFFESEAETEVTNQHTTSSISSLPTTPTTFVSTEPLSTSTMTTVNSSIPITTTLSHDHNKRVSYDCDSNWPLFKNDWVLINNIIRVFIPFILLCICNSWIAVALSKAQRTTEALFRDSNNCSSTHIASSLPQPNFKQVIKFKVNNYNDQSPNMNNKSKSTQKQNNNHLGIINSTDGCSDSEVFTEYAGSKKNSMLSFSEKRSSFSPGSINHHNSMSHLANRHIKGRSNNNHISIMLLAVSIGFILFNLPFAIRTLLQRHFKEKFKILDFLYHDDNFLLSRTSKTEIQNAVKYEFFSSLTHFLLDLNYIANFFLYFFSGSRFRSQLFIMFKCKKPAKNYINYTNSHFIDRKKNTTNSILVTNINANRNNSENNSVNHSNIRTNSRSKTS